MTIVWCVEFFFCVCVCDQMLSSKGTVLCLLCVSLVPLQQVDYDRFLLLLPAMCHVLHAVLIHHPHTTIRVLEDCLALVSCILSLMPAAECWQEDKWSSAHRLPFWKSTCFQDEETNLTMTVKSGSIFCNVWKRIVEEGLRTHSGGVRKTQGL